MKHIQKNHEPPELQIWKDHEFDPGNEGWKPTWDNFQGKDKDYVKECLLLEQGSICCYCNGPISLSNKTSHIEHVKPRDFCTEAEKIEYGNMMVSCQGEDEEDKNEKTKRVPRFCGHARENWNTASYISPLNPTCEKRFYYFKDGIIKGKDESANEMIIRLNLSFPLLRKKRESAIDGAIVDLDSLSNEDLRAIRNDHIQRDENQNFRPYCSAVVSFINDLLGE